MSFPDPDQPSAITPPRKWHSLGPVKRAVGLGSWLALIACQADPSPQKAPEARPPAPVATAVISKDSLSVEHSYQGEVWATGEASLSVAEAGRVRRVHVIDGDRVKQGQLLLELDDRLARAELSQAIAEREQADVERDQAQREAQRFRELQQQQVTSELESERETAQAAALTARTVGVSATVQARSERVQRHRIVAPFTGVVARRHVDPGAWLTPGQAALDLVTDTRIEVLVRVPVELLDKLSNVESITLSSAGAQVPAKLSGTVNALERSTRTALIRLAPEVAAEWLRAGSAVQVNFRLHKAGGLVVPRDALVHGVAATRVVRVVDNKAEPINVEIVAKNHEHVLIHSKALRLGDRVVTRGNERLRPGQAVAPTSAPRPASSSSRTPAASSQPAPQRSSTP